jgi:hypothetical protein
MKRIISVGILFLFAFRAFAGGEGGRTVAVEHDNAPAVSAGLNISLISVPRLADYINTTSNGGNAASTFGTGIELFSALEFPAGESWGVKIDYGYLFKSYSIIPQAGGTQNLFFAVHAPSLLFQYVTSGPGYFLKIAGGGGYHVGRIENTTPFYRFTTVYKAGGPGLKAELVGQTALSDNVYVHLGGTLRWELLGTVKDNNGNTLNAGSTGSQDVSLSLFAAGVEIGVAWYF